MTWLPSIVTWISSFLTPGISAWTTSVRLLNHVDLDRRGDRIARFPRAGKIRRLVDTGIAKDRRLAAYSSYVAPVEEFVERGRLRPRCSRGAHSAGIVNLEGQQRRTAPLGAIPLAFPRHQPDTNDGWYCIRHHARLTENAQRMENDDDSNPDRSATPHPGDTGSRRVAGCCVPSSGQTQRAGQSRVAGIAETGCRKPTTGRSPTPETALDVAGYRATPPNLREVEAWRSRMEEGTYGACVEYGEAIPYARLAANPSAARCIACQESSAAAALRSGSTKAPPEAAVALGLEWRCRPWRSGGHGRRFVTTAMNSGDYRRLAVARKAPGQRTFVPARG